MKEEHVFKDSDAPESSKGTKGARPTRWDKQPPPSPLNMMEAKLTACIVPPIHNVNWQALEPDDSNSKVLGNEDDLLVDDTTDSISSVLSEGD